MSSVFLALLCAQAKPADVKPDKIAVSTWVREDIFAGFLADDLEGFERGVAKLDALLAANANDAEALAWRGGARVYQAVRAAEARNQAGFDQFYARAKADLDRAREVADRNTMGAVFAIKGGTFAILSDRLPADLRREGWTFVRENYGALREGQKAFFDKLPLHMRGEVMAGLAQAEQRLTGALGAALTELISALPDSVYAKRAQRWREQPDTAARTSLTCQTCHDAGRLEAVKARQTKQ